MKLPYLEIKQTFAEIGLQSVQPPLKIKQHPADVEIKQDHVANVQISKTAAKLYIDQTESFADADLKGSLRRSHEFLQQSKQEIYEYIAKTARQGDKMMQIEHGGNAIAHIAAANSNLPQQQYGIGWIPSSADKVKFDYEPSKLTFNVERTEPDIRVNTNEPTYDVQKWQTNVYLEQKNNITFHTVGLHVDKAF